jgi:hypothetical protein
VTDIKDTEWRVWPRNLEYEVGRNGLLRSGDFYIKPSWSKGAYYYHYRTMDGFRTIAITRLAWEVHDLRLVATRKWYEWALQAVAALNTVQCEMCPTMITKLQESHRYCSKTCKNKGRKYHPTDGGERKVNYLDHTPLHKCRVERLSYNHAICNPMGGCFAEEAA